METTYTKEHTLKMIAKCNERLARFPNSKNRMYYGINASAIKTAWEEYFNENFSLK